MEGAGEGEGPSVGCSGGEEEEEEEEEEGKKPRTSRPAWAAGDLWPRHSVIAPDPFVFKRREGGGSRKCFTMTPIFQHFHPRPQQRWAGRHDQLHYSLQDREQGAETHGDGGDTGTQGRHRDTGETQRHAGDRDMGDTGERCLLI
ncbi:hypothetical protein EYF80_020080 [Liparis tanakae]|uniref:Uncharacterized protein n=1 Tax=Liparis tanakae TaxID=230148 RepID=A0A4Z2HV45_9TELE|nr:hypothetical protein EYF80_020080 [Liparis tanakae]